MTFDFSKGPPPALYKYYTAETGLKVLTSGKVAFTPPNRFNDPFDVNPDHQLSQSEIEIFARHQTNKNLEDPRAGAPHVEPMMTKIFRERVSQTLGIFCLTEHKDNRLMWAHYADEHKGCVLEFSFTDRPVNRLRKVVYSVDRPIFKDQKPEAVNDVFFTKGKEWEYEDEWRMIARLKDLEETTPGVYLYELPAGTITAIYLGARMDDVNHRSFVDATSDAILPTRRIFKASPDIRKYQLNFDPIA